jgi:hypothetical protein
LFDIGKPEPVILPRVVLTHGFTGARKQLTANDTRHLCSLENGNLFGFNASKITSATTNINLLNAVGFEVLTAVVMKTRVLSSAI